jgi:UDP-2-acetamido-3-amino-2,3-dideoxy-glucuronate N-acetyltransferase
MSTSEAGYQAHSSAIVDEGAKVGEGTFIWHFCHVSAGAVIGKSCVLGQNVFVADGVIVGDRVRIQNNVSLYDGVVLEDDVFCGPSAVFTNVRTPRSGVSRKNEYARTVVRRGASIGANATIVCGVEIGAYSLVGAGAVVTVDVEPHRLMVGVPARAVGWVSHAGEILGEDLVCPRTGQRYQIAGGELRDV